MARFESRIELAGSPERVFDYILRPANLQGLTPPEAQLVYVDPPEEIQLGTRLVCKMQAGGIIQNLAYEIVEFVAPRRYREQMVEGPLRLWLHDSIVVPSANGCIVIEEVEFEAPSGLLGLIMNDGKIMEALEDGFDYRGKVLQEVFG